MSMIKSKKIFCVIILIVITIVIPKVTAYARYMYTSTFQGLQFNYVPPEKPVNTSSEEFINEIISPDATIESNNETTTPDATINSSNETTTPDATIDSSNETTTPDVTVEFSNETVPNDEKEKQYNE